MGNVSGYCKHVDDKDSTRHLIRLNQLYDKNWKDKFVYDFQNNEIECFENGKYIKICSTYIRDIGDCYKLCQNGKLELYYKIFF